MKCCWTLIQKQDFLLFWFSRNLERFCNEWWYSGRSGDLTTPDHSPSQREVLWQGGWEQPRIFAREEHGTRPSPGLQYDGAKKEGVHDSAKSCKSFFSVWLSSSCFQYLSSYALLYVWLPVYFNRAISALYIHIWLLKESSLVQVIVQNKWKMFSIIKDGRCLFLLFNSHCFCREFFIYMGPFRNSVSSRKLSLVPGT